MKLNYLLLHIRNIFFGFSHCDGWLREFGLCVPHIYNPVEQEVMAGQFHAPSHPGVLKNLNMNGIYFRDILLTRISRGANNCGQHPLEKSSYVIMRFSPHFQLFYFNDRLEFCKFFEGKIKRINNADLFSQLPLLIFIKGANISGGHCIYFLLIVTYLGTFIRFAINYFNLGWMYSIILREKIYILLICQKRHIYLIRWCWVQKYQLFP